MDTAEPGSGDTSGAGATAAIRHALRGGESLTFDELRVRCQQYTHSQVRTNLAQLVSFTCEVISDGLRPAHYSVASAAARQAGDRQALTAFTPLKRDPFANWRLCDRDPYETSRAAVHRVVR